jgi:hypothetical protein
MDIPLIKKQSLEIRCNNIKTPLDLSAPEKTYFISSELQYDYYALGQAAIEVKHR